MQDLKQKSYNEWLVMRSQEGEVSAFNSLIKAWRPRYYLHAYHRLGDKELANDVTQECLLSISRSLPSLTDPAAFPRWSFSILERRCVDSLRKLIRERQFIQSCDEVPDQLGEQDQGADISLNSILATLDPRLATVLRLHYLEAFSIEEMAEILQTQPGTVKSRLFYARKLLIKSLED